jgi:hypothetical protein
VVRQYGPRIVLWVRPRLADMVRRAIKRIGYTDGRSAMVRVAPLVVRSYGNEIQDEIKAAKALRNIEKAAVKKTAQIKALATKKGMPVSLAKIAKKVLERVVSKKAPRLLRAAKKAA